MNNNINNALAAITMSNQQSHNKVIKATHEIKTWSRTVHTV